MSKILKPSELAKALDISCASISMAIKNGTLDWNEDKMIDIHSLKSKIWIDKQKAKGKIFDLNRIYDSNYISSSPKSKIQNDKKIENDFKENESIIVVDGNYIQDEKKSKKSKSENIDSDDLYQEKIKLEVRKLKNTAKLDEFKIAKLEGELIPTQVVETVFLYAVNDMKKTYEQNIDNIINIFNKILGGEQRHFIEMKKKAMEQLSQTGIDFKENLMNGLENAIIEYSEVRGRGERR